MIYRIGQLTLLIVAIVLLTGLSGCLSQQQEQPAEETEPNGFTDQTTDQTDQTLSGDNLLTTDPNTLTAELNQGLEIATKKAQEWQNGAQIVAVQVEVPASFKKTYVSSRYVFASTNVNEYYWTIALTSGNENYVRAIIPKEDYFSTNLKVILPEFWRLNYVEALQTSEQNGGTVWRQSHNLGGVTLILSRGQPKSWLYWQVEYLAVSEDGERQPTENFKVKFNSYSGEVVE